MSEHDDSTLRTEISAGPRPTAPRAACVVVIHGEGMGRRLDIGDAPVVVGRSETADLVIAHKSVSRAHCRIWRTGATCRVIDLGATNTTRVNDARLTAERELLDGDQLTIGESLLKFITQDSVEARYHEEIYQLATHDPLTGLCNRRHFDGLADTEIARALRHGRPLSLCMLDIDHFKPINDRHGHACGDEVLRMVGRLLQAHARNEDVAARIGGEEFALLLPECGLDDATALAERLREAIAATAFDADGGPLRVTASIGVASIGPGRDARAPLLAAADAALYRAKSEGRNRVRVSQ